MSQSSQGTESNRAYWSRWRKRMDALFPENPPILFLDPAPQDHELQPVELLEGGSPGPPLDDGRD